MKNIALAAFALAILSPAIAAHANEPNMSSQAAFIIYDTDRSGSIDADEYQAYLRNAGIHDNHAETFASLDTNNNQELTLSEMQD